VPDNPFFTLGSPVPLLILNPSPTTFTLSTGIGIPISPGISLTETYPEASTVTSLS